MPLPHYRPRDKNNYEPIYSYCGNCLSDNLKKDLDSCYFILDIQGKCECLDCGWKGTKFECANMSPLERNKNYLKLNSRRTKIEKLRKICSKLET